MRLYASHYLQTATPKERLIVSVVILAVLLVILSIVGMMQGQDLDDQDAFYCEAVASKMYPDYNGNYNEICPTAQE